MAKKTKGSMVGMVGGILIGAAILLFVTTLVLNNLKTAADPGNTSGNETTNPGSDDARAAWNATNATVDQIKTMLTVSAILLAVMGIVVVGSQIIGYIGGGFGA